MRAVGAGARDQLDVSVEQQRRAGFLDAGCKRLDPIDLAAIVRLGKPHQHCGNIGHSEQLFQQRRERRRILDRLGCEIEPGRGRGRGRLVRRHV